MVSLGRGSLLGFVDPRGVWEWWRCWWFTDEPFRVSPVGGVEDGCPLLLDCFCPSVVHVCGGVVPDTGVTVLIVVSGEEALREAAGILD